MKKKKEFKTVDKVKVETELFKPGDVFAIFEERHQRIQRRERILDIIVGLVFPILIVLSFAILIVTNAVKEIKMSEDCVAYLVQTYNISDDYMYEVEEIHNIKTSNENIEYLCKVTIYNDDWHIEAIMSVNENDDDKRKINIEKILKEMKGDISD